MTDSPRAARAMHIGHRTRTRTRAMRALELILLCLFVTAPCAAQDTAIVIHPDSIGPGARRSALPRAVAEEVVSFHNAAGTARLVGRTRLPQGHEWSPGASRARSWSSTAT
jgi:hypothetical protein